MKLLNLNKLAPTNAMKPRMYTWGSGTVVRFLALALGLPLATATILGCDDMSDNARWKPLEAHEFFNDGKLARHPVQGTVPRNPVAPALTMTRDAGGKHVDAYPFEITRANLERGKQRYEIYCSVCHGATGEGDGMIVRRGFTKPPSLNEQRLRDAAPGHYVEVIANGWGAMYSYSDRVNPEDRWNIAAYIKTLQLSQNVSPDQLSPEDRQLMAQQQQRTQASTAPSTQPAH